MQRIKAFNSTLHNVSPKRLADMKSGAYKKPKPKPIASRSKRKQILWDAAREESFKRWKGLDALTLKPLNDTPWDCHHAFILAQHCHGDKYYDQLNLCPINRYMHRKHSQGDKLFFEWQNIIRANAKKLGIETL